MNRKKWENLFFISFSFFERNFKSFAWIGSALRFLKDDLKLAMFISSMRTVFLAQQSIKRIFMAQAYFHPLSGWLEVGQLNVKAFTWKKISQPSMRFAWDVHLRSQMGTLRVLVTGWGALPLNWKIRFEIVEDAKHFLILKF